VQITGLFFKNQNKSYGSGYFRISSNNLNKPERRAKSPIKRHRPVWKDSMRKDFMDITGMLFSWD